MLFRQNYFCILSPNGKLVKFPDEGKKRAMSLPLTVFVSMKSIYFPFEHFLSSLTIKRELRILFLVDRPV